MILDIKVSWWKYAARNEEKKAKAEMELRVDMQKLWGKIRTIRQDAF